MSLLQSKGRGTLETFYMPSQVSPPGDTVVPRESSISLLQKECGQDLG